METVSDRATSSTGCCSDAQLSARGLRPRTPSASRGRSTQRPCGLPRSCAVGRSGRSRIETSKGKIGFMIRKHGRHLVSIVFVGTMLGAVANAGAAFATPLRLPPPRAPIMLPDLPLDDDEPHVGDDQAEADADECPMACKSAAELPLVAMIAESCALSTLGRELFQLVREQEAGSTGLGDDLGSWCWWFVLAAWIDDDIDDEIAEAYARIRSRTY